MARVAVRLAEEMGCDAKTLNTLYLAGLLHDIGKIGIDDGVLRKAGKLSEAEYEHIKRHAEIGHHILEDLSKLEEVLPVVLHHHESWDGGGYPHRLSGGQIPLAARIVAVADAFDAMSSNRPYRKGMPDQQVDRILRDGAGQQWDPEVIEAFFRSREDIRRMCRDEQQPVRLPARRPRGSSYPALIGASLRPAAGPRCPGAGPWRRACGCSRPRPASRRRPCAGSPRWR